MGINYLAWETPSRRSVVTASVQNPLTSFSSLIDVGRSEIWTEGGVIIQALDACTAEQCGQFDVLGILPKVILREPSSPELGGAALVANPAALIRIGEACFEEAIRPIAMSEIREEVPGWVSAIVADAITVSAVSRGSLLPSEVAALGLVIAIVLLLMVVRLRALAAQIERRPPDLPDKPPADLLRQVARAENEEARARDAHASALNAKEMAQAQGDDASWKDLIPGVRALKDRWARQACEQSEQRLIAASREVDAAVRAHQAADGAVQAWLTRRNEEQRCLEVRFANRYGKARRTGVVTASLAGMTTALLLIVTAGVPVPFWGEAASSVLKPDSALQSALEAHPELVRVFAHHCGITPHPDPGEVRPQLVSFTNTLSPPDNSSNDDRQPTNRLPNCTVGKACGMSCIPQDRVCRVGMTGPGLACGQGWIAANKVCRIEVVANRPSPSTSSSQGAIPAGAPSPFSASGSTSTAPPLLPIVPQVGSQPPFSSTTTRPSERYIDSYTRRDGTRVEGYYRTLPNSTRDDNYSRRGNTNPHTGSSGKR